MKEKLVIVLLFVLGVFLVLTWYGDSTSELKELKEEVLLENYNISILEKECETNLITAKENSNNVIKYIRGGLDSVSFISGTPLSDLDYFKYIVTVTSEQQLNSGFVVETNLEELLRDIEIVNYQFFDEETNSIIDYYFYQGNKPVVLELIYSGGSIVGSKIY